MDEDQLALAAAEQEQRFRDQQKRAEKAEAEATALKEQLEALSRKEEKPVLPAQEQKIEFDSLADNLSVLRNLEDDEVNELRSQAKDMGIDPIKFAKSKAWQAHLNVLRTDKKTQNSTPEPSHRTAVFEGKTYAEVVQGDTSPEAKQSAFAAQRDALLNRGRNQSI
jgi:hypothetical protein